MADNELRSCRELTAAVREVTTEGDGAAMKPRDEGRGTTEHLVGGSSCTAVRVSNDDIDDTVAGEEAFVCAVAAIGHHLRWGVGFHG